MKPMLNVALIDEIFLTKPQLLVWWKTMAGV